ncbi:MAG TPA: membrane protein insertase YidC [Mariprofundaceae bacterium]|nr:membrane protein insertase YidC [Mariprofundaceae bacterium]
MEQRNIILAFALSMAVLLGWQLMLPKQENGKSAVSQGSSLPGKDGSPAAAQTAAKPASPASSTATAAADSSATSGVTPKEVKAEKIGELSNNVVTIDVNSRGALVSARMKNYRESIKRGSPPVAVLHQSKARASYINAGILGHETPTFHVVAADRHSLTMQATLSDGRVWERKLTLAPGSYDLHEEDRIRNGKGLKVFYQVVARNPDSEGSSRYEFRGAVALLHDKLKTTKYEDLDKDGAMQVSAKGGWTGIMNRYFIASVIGDQKLGNRYYFKGDGQVYQAGLITKGEQAGSDAVYHIQMYVGPKSIPILKKLNVGLERCVDFGWIAFIAKPMHSFLLLLHNYISNFGLCIILLVVLIKLIFFWPTKKSYESMAGMRKLQPEMQRMKEQYGDDRQKMGQEMMALYKKHKVNPMGGCLPIIIQIPVFFSLYKTLLISIELRHAPFFGWIHDLSAMDPFYVLPVLMGASMLVQQKLNPAPPDPMQAKIMRFMPIIFTVMFLFFPSGLVLYWLVNNVLSIAQQWHVMKAQKAI